MSAWVVASSWLGWQNAAICMKLSIQAWSSLIVSVYRSGMLACVQQPPPLRRKKNRFLFCTHATECKNVFSQFHRKILTLIFLVTLYSNDISSAFTVLVDLAEFLLNSSIFETSRRLSWILYFDNLYAELWFTKLFRNKISNNNNLKKKCKGMFLNLLKSFKTLVLW